MSTTSIASKQKPQIVLFGDSLTEWGFEKENRGFGWYLGEWYKGSVDIVNEGYAGFTSETTKAPFVRLLTRLQDPSSPPTLLLTIFLGANDACLVGPSTYVPLPSFTSNIRAFVDAILTSSAPGLRNTKVVLISCPPINIKYEKWGLRSSAGDSEEEDEQAEEELMMAGRGYRTYKSKKRFAEEVVAIGEAYGEGKVAVVDFWRACIDAGLEEQGRGGEVVGTGKGEKYEEGRLPGCGLKRAKDFQEGWFTDGLHLGPLGYDCLSKALIEVVMGKWPELAPGQLEA